MKFRPETLVHRVLIKPYVETETASGIVIARDRRSQAINTNKGEILMFGDQAWKAFGCDTPPVKVGDQVYYAHYGAKIISNPSDPETFYVIVNDDDVLVGYTENE